MAGYDGLNFEYQPRPFASDLVRRVSIRWSIYSDWRSGEQSLQIFVDAPALRAPEFHTGFKEGLAQFLHYCSVELTSMGEKHVDGFELLGEKLRGKVTLGPNWPEWWNKKGLQTYRYYTGEPIVEDIAERTTALYAAWGRKQAIAD
ncbi:MAG: hypothetical protein OK454_10975 [Thaumarchaeota archaeon]|nr:hypothetical protein [Nitrososphaerota archaeon]